MFIFLYDERTFQHPQGGLLTLSSTSHHLFSSVVLPSGSSASSLILDESSITHLVILDINGEDLAISSFILIMHESSATSLGKIFWISIPTYVLQRKDPQYFVDITVVHSVLLQQNQLYKDV